MGGEDPPSRVARVVLVQKDDPVRGKYPVYVGGGGVSREISHNEIIKTEAKKAI